MFPWNFLLSTFSLPSCSIGALLPLIVRFDLARGTDLGIEVLSKGPICPLYSRFGRALGCPIWWICFPCPFRQFDAHLGHGGHIFPLNFFLLTLSIPGCTTGTLLAWIVPSDFAHETGQGVEVLTKRPIRSLCCQFYMPFDYPMQ